MIGDYGRVFWVDGDGIEVAQAGGGGYGDFTDGVLRSISKIEVVYPPLKINGTQTKNLDSGNDNIYGNGARDVMFGCGGDYGKSVCVGKV